MQNRKDERLSLICECCHREVDRWDMEMVKAESAVFDINNIIEQSGQKVEFNFACPQCVTDLSLFPVDHEMAQKFRAMNERLREQYATSFVQ